MTYILGGWQSDFSANWARQGMELADAFAEVVQHGLEATGLDAKEIECGHVGNFVGDLFAGQGLLGGFFGLVHPDFDGMPTARHEAACASGSVAILAAAAEIEAGRYDLACVLGIEQMRNVSGQQAADNLGAAAWAGHEYLDAKFPWPRAFSDLTDEYERRYGIDPAHLMRISEINFANGKKNPNAQTRQWAFTDKSFTADDEANPVVEGRTRKMDCGQVTDGAAVIFLASPRRAAEYAAKRGIALESLPRIKGWGHRSAPITYDAKIKASAGQALRLPAGPPRGGGRPPQGRCRRPIGDRRGRDPRLLRHDRIHGHRPPRPHRAGRVLEGGRGGRHRDRRATCRSTPPAA